MNATKPIAPFYGLILAGGKSTRMGRDKSLLEYHGIPQIEHCYRLLIPLCETVYISNRREQADLPAHKITEQIHDNYHERGPIGGILSAMESYPDAAWFILACDLPFVREGTLLKLQKNRDHTKFATAYRCQTKPGPEPLIAIYEPSLRPVLEKALFTGITCPRKILSSLEICLIEPDAPHELSNVNDSLVSNKIPGACRNVKRVC